MQAITLLGSGTLRGNYTGTVGKCPATLSKGAKFTGDILGIPWPMEIISETISGIYTSKPVSSTITIPKSKLPAQVAALIERNLAYLLTFVVKKAPQLMDDPALLLKVAKTLGGFYPGKANLDKYVKPYIPFDFSMISAAKYSQYSQAKGEIIGSRLAPIRAPLLTSDGKWAQCSGEAISWEGIDGRILIAQDLGSSYGFALYNPPDKSALEEAVDTLMTPVVGLTKFWGKVANLALNGIEAVVSILKQALGVLCQAAQGQVAQLTNEYLGKLSAAEGAINAGTAVTASGTVSTTGGVTADAATYSAKVQAISASLCGKTSPPLTPQVEPKSILPYVLIGGGVLAAATIAAIGIRRRR